MTRHLLLSFIIFYAACTAGTALMLDAWASNASADTSACYNVPDADGRAACIARMRQDRSICYSIQRPDMRALCLAEVGK